MWERIAAFERARDTLASRDESDQAAKRLAGGLRTAFSISDTRARWETKGAHYLRARPGLRNQWVTAPKTLDAAVIRLIDAAAPALAEAFDVELSRLAFHAWREWPKQSGYSRSMIHVSVHQLNDTTFAGSVSSDAPYTTFIKGNPARRYLLEPAKLVADHIARDVPFGIAARYSGGR